jgi:hypothetical protein
MCEKCRQAEAKWLEADRHFHHMFQVGELSWSGYIKASRSAFAECKKAKRANHPESTINSNALIELMGN